MVLEKLGVSRWDVRDPYHLALTLDWPAFLALLIAGYVAINLAFALLYVALPGSIANLRPKSVLDAFFFSVETFATVGYGVMAPATLAGHLAATVEIFVGMIFTGATTGLAFVRLSRPKAKILFADRLVVTRHGGRPALMVRVGNGRTYALTQASARLTVFLVEHQAEGQHYRRVVDLGLVRSDFPFFALTWTLVHELDEDSPLHGLSATRADIGELRLMVSISAHDPALAADVRAARSYDPSELAFGMRYADAVTWDGANTTVADMRRLSALEPDGGGDPAS